MIAYGRFNKRSGQMKFSCCDMVNGCGYHRQSRYTVILRKLWKKRARRTNKLLCKEE